jgi:tetratricopeptide (TPR) repeat protein
LLRLGQICFQREKLADAADLFKRAAIVAPQDAAAHGSLGSVLNALGRHAEALPQIRKAIALNSGNAGTYIDLGNALAGLDRHEEALAAYREAAVLAPGLTDAYFNAGNSLVALGRHEDAVIQFEKVLTQSPNHPGALNNLGSLFMLLRRPEAALECFKRALSGQPKFALASSNLGKALTALGRHDEAADAYRKALAHQPDDPVLLNKLANSLSAAARPAESLEIFERLIGLDPNAGAFHYGAGNALLFLGRLEEARRALERAVILSPHVPTFHCALVNAGTVRAEDPRLQVMEEMARNAEAFSADEQIGLHFALAKAYDDLKRYELAFGHLQKGNAIKRHLISYDEAREMEFFRAIATSFTAELFETRRGAGNPSEVPVFIVGMPRSGTTLIEHILASHPDVFGAGELTDLNLVITGSQTGARLRYVAVNLLTCDLRGLGERYLEKLLPKAPAAKRITDKLPGNFCHAGFIHLMLPKARIIHVRRDPLDTCFSCYSRLFGRDLNFAYDLGELGRFYKGYEALMAHWRSVLPEGAMLEVEYESLIGNFEEEVRRIVEYCGLEWDKRCLKFYETERSVHTVSAVQVRQPVFRSSVGRWRHYKDYLGPLLEVLDAAQRGKTP